MLGAIAMHVKSSKPPMIDPNNQRPVIDTLRDAMRSLIVDVYGPGTTPAPVPVVPPVTLPVLPSLPTGGITNEMVLQLVQSFLSHLQTLQPPASTPATTPKTPA